MRALLVILSVVLFWSLPSGAAPPTVGEAMRGFGRSLLLADRLALRHRPFTKEELETALAGLAQARATVTSALGDVCGHVLTIGRVRAMQASMRNEYVKAYRGAMEQFGAAIDEYGLRLIAAGHARASEADFAALEAQRLVIRRLASDAHLHL